MLLIRKPHSNEFRSVQDLRAINDIVQDLHPSVLNHYTLVNSIPGGSLWYSVLDLKDAFLCILDDQDSQPLFAFEWQDPESSAKSQYWWAVLPQGFKSSPTTLGETLSQDLKDLKLKGGTLLQYRDNLLITGTSFQQCLTNIIATLNHLASYDY